MKAKRILIPVLLLLLVLTLLPAAVHADGDTCDDSPDGKHSWVYYDSATCTDGGWGSWQCEYCYAWKDDGEATPAKGHRYDRGTITTAATCTADGIKTLTCTICGDTKQETIPALGEQAHVWDNGTVTTAATCGASGVRTFTCTICGSTYTETIPATGEHISTVIPAVAATCTSGGKTDGSKCSVCGTILTAQQDTPALGHSYDGGTVTTAATCTADGVKTFSCTRCGDTYTEAISATGHSAVTLPAVAATCTSGGKTDGSQCSVCGAVLTPQQDTPALGHSYDGGTVTAAATCTADGVKTFTCTRCGNTYSEAIPATGHSAVSLPAVAATCTSGGKTEGSQCSVCGTVLTAQQDTPALGHSYDGGSVTAAATCTANGTKTFTCTRCGDTYTEAIPATGHSAVSLHAVAATCTSGGKTEGSQCSVCGTVLTAQQDTPALGHSYDGGTVTAAATCTGNGTKTFTCSRCGDTYTEAIPAAGHIWGKEEIIAEPAGMTPGLKAWTCSVCGETKTEEIPAEEGASSVIKLLRNGSHAPGGAAPEADGTELRIVTQPKSGTLPQDGSEMCILTVVATGGEPGYTYQWYRETGLGSVNVFLPQSVAGTIGEATVAKPKNEYTEAAAAIAAAIQGNIPGSSTIDSTMPPIEAGSSGIVCTEVAPATSWTVLDRIGEPLAGEIYDTLGAVAPGEYYCKVTDQDGNSVLSDTATVRWRIHFAVQPLDGLNLYNNEVILYAEAADGILEEKTAYNYQWYDSDGNLFTDSTDPSFHVPAFGAYYCVASDDMDSVTSNTVTVEDYAPLKGELIFTDDGNKFLDIGQILMNIDGGVPPYTVQFGLLGEELTTEYYDEPIAKMKFVTQPGTYELQVQDSAQNFASAYATVYNQPIEILTQPEGGTLAGDGTPHTLHIMMKSGKAPFSYYLYTWDDFKQSYVSDWIEGVDWMADFDVYFEGRYYIEVVDAENNFARSDTVGVAPHRELEVSLSKEDVVIDDPTQTIPVKVYAKGGEEPYSYQWYRLARDKDERALQLDLDTNVIEMDPYDIDAWCYCIVTDARGATAKTELIGTEFTADTPFIKKHPGSITKVNKGGAMPTLTCEAICGNGRTPKYRWQYYIDGIWHDTIHTGTEYTPNPDMVPGGVGQFRCVVTDPYTRKTAVSDIGYVYTEMKVLSYEQIGTEKKLKMEFEGGVAPYDITVNAYYTTIWGYEFDDKFYFGWQITEYHNTHVNKNRYDATSQCSIREENIYDHTEINIGVPELYSRQLYKEQYTWMALIPPIYYKTNTYILYPYLYQVVITDALGNQLETAWVVCKWE